MLPSGDGASRCCNGLFGGFRCLAGLFSVFPFQSTGESVSLESDLAGDDRVLVLFPRAMWFFFIAFVIVQRKDGSVAMMTTAWRKQRRLN
jgi:hypothetical protein